MRGLGRAGLLVVLAFAARLARADEPVDPFTEPDESELLRAEERVVTVASRYAQTLARASSVVTVITAAEIREQGQRTLADVLSSIPGVYIAVSKEGRRLAWVRGVTGSDNDQILLLVDGVPWYDGLYEHAWIDEYVPLQAVRQIEVIRGPSSTSYGTNAFAAVINVVTYGASDLRGGFVRGETGSFGRGAVTAVFGDRVGDQEQVGVRVYARALTLDGDGVELLPDGTYDASGDAPRRALGAGLKLEMGPFELRYDHVDYRHDALLGSEDDALSALASDLDSFAYRYRDDYLAARGDIGLGPVVRLTPEVFAQLHDDPGQYATFDIDEDGDLSSTLVDAEKRTALYGGSVQAELRPWLDHVTLIGVGMDADQLIQVDDLVYDDLGVPQSGTFFAQHAILTDGYAFLQHQWTPGWWLELSGGLRVDHRGYICRDADNLCYLPKGVTLLSPRLGVSVAPDSLVGLKATYGRAFRTPTARELLIQTTLADDVPHPNTLSNTALDPEVMDNVEAEVMLRPTRALSARLDGFGSRLRHEIAKVPELDGVPGDVSYANIEGANIVGAEAEATLDLPQLVLAGSVSWVHAEDLEYGQPVYGFPAEMAHARVTWRPIPQLRLSALGDFVGRRPQAVWSPDAGAEDGAPYGLLHFAIATDGLLKDRVRADLSVRNALNTAYTRPLPQELVNETYDVTVTGADGQDQTLTYPSYPYAIEGEERSVVMGVEIAF